MASRFVPNRGFVRQQDREPATRKYVERVAEEAAEATRAVGRAIARTGAYAASIQARGNRVESDDPGAIYIEFGSRNNPVFAPLRRGASSTGAKVGPG